jgi:hypothetical protein
VCVTRPLDRVTSHSRFMITVLCYMSTNKSLDLVTLLIYLFIYDGTPLFRECVPLLVRSSAQRSAQLLFFRTDDCVGCWVLVVLVVWSLVISHSVIKALRSTECTGKLSLSIFIHSECEVIWASAIEQASRRQREIPESIGDIFNFRNNLGCHRHH